MSQSDFYNAAGGIVKSSNSPSPLTSDEEAQYSFLLPNELRNLNILQDENVFVNFTVSYKSYTFKTWTAANEKENYLYFQAKLGKYNNDYADYHRPTSFFFINKDQSQNACHVKDSNLYFPSQYEWVGELKGGFTIRNGNIKFKNLQLTGSAPMKVEDEACVVLHKCTIYGATENNDTSLSPAFYDNADHLVGIDGGTIYIATNNGSVKESMDTETFISKNIGCTLDDTNVCVVRFNHIKNYRGRGTNRGIYCDDDAYNFLLLGNIIENTPNDHSISARFAEANRKTFYFKKDYNKKVFYNVVDNGFRFEGNMKPAIIGGDLINTEDFDGCEMKYNLYLNKYGNLSNIIRYTTRDDNVYIDDSGFFTEDGRIDSAYNIKEWKINIKNRRHERRL